MIQAQTRCARAAKSDAFEGMPGATVVPLAPPVLLTALALQLVAFVALVQLALKSPSTRSSAACEGITKASQPLALRSRANGVHASPIPAAWSGLRVLLE